MGKFLQRAFQVVRQQTLLGTTGGRMWATELGNRTFHPSTRVMDKDDKAQPRQFDETMLEYLVCPLSKSPLKYDRAANELVSEELQVAYPIVNGIPNLIPQDARKLNEEEVS